MIGLAIGYLGLVAAALALAETVRRQVTTPRKTDVRDGPPAVLIGYLCGGPSRAVETAVALLLSRRAIVATEDGRLVSSAGVPPADGLVGAVHTAADGGTRLIDLPHHPVVLGQLAATRADLEHRGLARTEAERHRARRAAAPLVAVFAIGCAVLIPTFDKVALVGTVVALAGLVRYLDVPIAQRHAEAMLHAMQENHEQLRPLYGQSPAIYTRSTLPVAVALFGPAVLWIADPDFARRAGVALTLAVVGGEQAGSDTHG
jgi:uncharacterized protein (TIGR04222 family)